MTGRRDVIRRFNRFRRKQKRKLLMACGIELYIKTEDRKILEQTIFPYFVQRSDVSEILFVGCHWYTKGYNKLFEGKNYRTLDVDPKQAKFGAKSHIPGSMEDICQYFKPGELDVIICNGVFGWGLDARENVDKAFLGCYDCLREGGLLVLGWNDVPGHKPFPLEECESLKRFSPFIFPALSTSRYLTEGADRHIYNFYVKTSEKDRLHP